MKVLPFNIPKTETKALIFQEDKGKGFYGQLHQHEEIQFSTILGGSGNIMVGDAIHPYAAGDTFIIGSHLPHLFSSEVKTQVQSHMLTLFFTKKSFGTGFFELSDFKEQQSLFRRLDQGVKLLDKKGEIQQLFSQLKKQKDLERIITFLELIRLATISRKTNLSSFDAAKNYGELHGSRMNDVINLTLSAYNRNLTLTEVAKAANMTTNAFCKYFKRYTRKTYFEFLLELRIQKACQMLREKEELSVLEVSELCGFRNTSNFNRKFKEHLQQTPSQYRKTNRII